MQRAPTLHIAAPPARGLHAYALLTAGATFLLLVAGGLVTSTDSGLAVPDWPLSYGTWFPPMVGGILYEHGHRMIAGLVGLMILGLAVWLRRREPRAWVRRLGYVALGAVVAQAALGGLTVLLLLPPAVSITHACVGQTVFCVVVSLAYATSPAWQATPRGAGDTVPKGWSALGMLAVHLAALQLALGAVIRHTGYAVMPHIGNAILLVAVALGLARAVAGARPARPLLAAHALRFAAFVVAQAGWGWGLFGHRGSVALRTGHVALGALVLAQGAVLAWELRRRRAPSAARASDARAAA